MWRHHLLVALRALARDKGFAAIGIGGLALALATVTLIATFVRHELSFDRWLPDAERVLRVQGTVSLPGRDTFAVAGAPPVMLPFILKDFPQVEIAARVLRTSATVRLAERAVAEPLALVDPTFFDILPFPVLAGDARAALADPNALVLTASAAERLLGTRAALGRELTLTDLGRTRTLRVAAVLADLPANTHWSLESFARWEDEAVFREQPFLRTSWSNALAYIYVKLKPGASREELNTAAWSAFQERNIPPDATVGDVPVRQINRTLALPLADIHLKSSGLGEMKSPGSTQRIVLLVAIAALILLVATFNFANLYAAQTLRRRREAAMRRVLGARRGQLARQVLIEALVVAAGAGLVALALTELALPWWREWVDRPAAALRLLNALPLAAGFVLLVLGTGTLAALYPAATLARLIPSQVLRSRSEPPGSAWVRQTLVALQFGLVIALTVGALGVIGQNTYLAQRDLGYRAESLLIVHGLNRPEVRDRAETLVAAWTSLPGVEAIARAQGVPGRAIEGGAYLQRADAPTGSGAIVSTDAMDENALSVFGMQMAAGRGFSHDFAVDDLTGLTPEQRAVRGGNLLLNEAATRALGFASAAAAVGQGLRLTAGPQPIPMTVVGVVKDAQFRGARSPIQPTFYLRDDDLLRAFVLRLAPGADANALRAAVEREWHRIVPDAPARIETIEQIRARDTSELKLTATVLAAAAALAIALASLGLMGVAAHQLSAQAREIALRRLYGAAPLPLLGLLLWRALKPVLLAAVLASALAAYALYRWLEGFPARVEVTPLWFVAATALALTVAAATIGARAWHAATVRPVQALGD